MGVKFVKRLSPRLITLFLLVSCVALTACTLSLSTPPASQDAQPVAQPATAGTVDLLVLDDGPTANTYLIEGASHTQFAIGADLVVYGEPIPGTEVAIALLKVIGQSPNSLTAQALLIDPENDIRARMRVDDQITFLTESHLVPVFDYAAGYLLRPSRIRLRPEHGLAVGAQLQALEFERINGAIVDALRTDTILAVTNLGVDGQVAAVELLTGTWPVTGTIVRLVEGPLVSPSVVMQPITTVTPTPATTYPCDAEILPSTGGDIVKRVRAIPSSNGPLMPAIQAGTLVEVREKFGESEIWYHIFDKSGREFGWLLSNYLRLSSSCPR